MLGLGLLGWTWQLNSVSQREKRFLSCSLKHWVLRLNLSPDADGPEGECC